MIRRLQSKAKRISTAALIVGAMEVTAGNRGHAAELPVAASTWVTSGSATRTASATTLTINQSSSKAIFNWDSFNISADGKVIFNQPDSSAAALNRIGGNSPSQIYGSLTANGQIYLINQNGFLFGSSARVNVGGLVASSLNITDAVFTNGLLTATTTDSDAALKGTTSATITVEPGAQLTTNAANQRILLAAKLVDNQGNISANDGQVILAAGDKVYVNASTDESLRGLLVEVSGSGTVTNSGTVTAERGNITAVGLAINQNGRMTATTSVSQNGSIRLQARSGAQANFDDQGNVEWQARQGGALTLASGSVTEVNPDAGDTTTAYDEQTQLKSQLYFSGKNVQFASGSQVQAAGGELKVEAASDPSASRSNSAVIDSAASIHVDAGASIDLSGSVATASVTRNLVNVELRANELADSPLQRDGALRGQTVTVDARVGTTVADVSASTALIGRDVLERTSQGGSVVFDSAGDVVVAANATIDVSGGALNYTGGVMQTSQLIKADGTVVDIGKASKDAKYVGIINPTYKYVSDRWGVTKTILAPGIGKYEAGYSEGANAGSIQVMGNAMALNGNFVAHVTAGVKQRSTDSLPQGGQFIVGISDATATAVSFRAPEITLTNQLSTVATGNTPLANGTALTLSTNFIQQGGFSRVQLASDKGITLASDAPVTLAAGGTLSLVGPTIAINSSITANSGSISAKAIALTTAPSNAGVSIGNGVTLDVSGIWTNDARSLLTTPTDRVALNAGSIALEQTISTGTLRLGNDVSLLANGGAWMKQSGTITGGKGGYISLIQNAGQTTPSDLNQTLSIGSNLRATAFGVQGQSGGTLTLRAPRIRIAGNETGLVAQSVTNTATRSGVLQLGSKLFTDAGFSSFVLNADSGAPNSDNAAATIEVAAGTAIQLQPKTWWLDGADAAAASGTSLAQIRTEQTLVDDQAKAASLSLATLALPSTTGVQHLTGVVMADGATITGNAGSSLNISSYDNITLDGDVTLAGGQVSATINGVDSTVYGYLDRKLVLGSHATLDVAGTVVRSANALGLQQGSVLDGGSVSLTAGRGSVDIQSGSVIDVSGTQGQLDVLPLGADNYERVTVASTGGSVSVSAQESIAMQGALHAQGGVANGAQNAGGSLTISLLRDPVTSTSGTAYPNNARIIEVVSQGKAAPANGVASVDVDLLRDSGIDSLTLKATNQIALEAGIDLTLDRSLTLDAPTLAVTGNGTARLQASAMTVGRTVTSSQTATTGTGSLTLQADALSLQGVLALNNIASANFISNGDIALTGGGISGGGRLLSAGDVTFKAQRVLPTTGSQYTVNASGKTVTFMNNGSAAGTPLSAAGQLTVNAANIVQGGSVYAPFGSITFNATNSVQLLSGSITSVSGNGALIPYGRVDNGTSWVWGLTSSSGTEITESPQGSINLNAGSVVMNSGSVVDVSGGGDLQAWQYTPGTGGKTDVLAAGNLADTYAIIPASAVGSITYDPLMWEGSDLKLGQSVYLSAGSGVPAGVYLLLPARYALSQGAYLVTALSAYQDLPAGSTAKTADGATVVSGYYTFGAQQNAAARTTGFAVRAGSYATTLAQYDTHLASTFFADKASSAGNVVALPMDAGTLTIKAAESLLAQGDVRGKGSASGKNATIDIAAGTTLEIDKNIVTSGTAGVVHLSSDVLQGWNAGSLLLGGVHNSAGAVDVSNSNIVVHAGADLVADQVILAAGQNVTLESGARVATRSASNASLTLDTQALAQSQTLSLTGSNADNASLLAVSDLGYLVADRGVARSTTGAGSITLQSGAQLATRGAVLLDGAGNFAIADSTINASGASWALGGSNLLIGGSTTPGNTLLINDSLQTSLQTARAITLTSEHDLTLAQATRLGNAATASLTVEADRIVNSAGNVASSLSASTINLRGINAQSGSTAQGTGTLSFNADNILIGADQLGISGFASTTLAASSLVAVTDAGGLSVNGNLNITSGAVTAYSGSQGLINASGDVTISTVSGSSINAHEQQTGGDLHITAQNIVDGGRILMPSGVVTLEATGNVSLTDAATIDVSGYKPELADAGSGGGAINIKAGGNVSMTSAAVLDVSAGESADAGSIVINALGTATLAAQMRGSADSDQVAGSFAVNAQQLNGFSALNRVLEAGGFTEARSYRTGTGSLTLDAGDSLTARQIELTADTGSITINGQVIARSTDRRSSIEINARDNVVLGAAAVLDASADKPATQKAGSILLSSVAGKLQLASGATVRATGKDQSGTLTLRAAATGSNFNNLESLPADLSNVDAVYLQPVKSGGIYTLSSATLTSSVLNAIRADLASYVTAAGSATVSRLGAGSKTNVFFTPYADIVRTGELTVGAYDFNAANWRFNGQAATVSIRATGNLNITGSLSDGFVDVDTGGVDLLAGKSVGYNMVAGADLASASNHAVSASSSANLSLAAGTIVRTGTGNIRLTAANDVKIGAGSSVYTGGQKAAESLIDDGSGFTIAFGKNGGNVDISAGRDVVGNVQSQSVTNWQIHWAPYTADQSGVESAAYWGTHYGAFDLNVGALGGGDVNVKAGRDVNDLSVAVTDSMADISGRRTALAGGNLSVTAGRNLNTGYFDVTQGRGDLRAWGAFGATGSRRANNRDIGTFLLAGDSRYTLNATRDVLLEGVVQQSLIDSTQFFSSYLNETAVWFSRYGADSKLEINSSGGGIEFNSGASLVGQGTFGYFGTTDLVQPQAASLALRAFGGDLEILGSPVLSPSSKSSLNLYAAGDVSGNLSEITMSDVDTGLAGLTADNVSQDGSTGVYRLLQSNKGVVQHRSDSTPSSVAAGNDITDLTLKLAEAVQLQAGRDIRNLTLDVQQSGTLTSTSISAGRDIYYSTNNSTRQISVAGSGLLEILAGRNIDLGITKGVVTTGNLLNGNLTDQTGADVIAVAGTTELAIDQFISEIVAPSESLKSALIAYVEKQTSSTGLSYAQALQSFKSLSSPVQTRFAINALFTELVATGREANADASKGFARGYSALASLFPGTDGQTTTYSGNISLPFSRFYTLDGGSIALLAPGGKIDVGLSNAPTTLSSSDASVIKSRKASELGIVAQGAGNVYVYAHNDVLVNSSRIFTLGGGDIAIWSSAGNIDAGKGAKSSLSAPPPTLTIDAQGNVSIDYGAAVAGSGIRTIVTSDDVTAGDVDLMAPAGFVNAGDAGIGSAGNLNIAAQKVVGLDNIQVGGTASGVPPETSGLGASLSGATSSAGGAASSASNAVSSAQSADKAAAAPIADAALSWLEVFVIGLGEDNCKQDDLECLKKQSSK